MMKKPLNEIDVIITITSIWSVWRVIKAIATTQGLAMRGFLPIDAVIGQERDCAIVQF